MRHSLSFALLLGGLLAAGPALAEDPLSVDELVERFNKQKQVFSEAESNGLGATRGLKLVTVEDVSVESADPNVAVSAEATTEPMDPGRGGSGPADGLRPARPRASGQSEHHLRL